MLPKTSPVIPYFRYYHAWISTPICSKVYLYPIIRLKYILARFAAKWKTICTIKYFCQIHKTLTFLLKCILIKSLLLVVSINQPLPSHNVLVVFLTISATRLKALVFQHQANRSEHFLKNLRNSEFLPGSL